jgi:hypothetical protein
VTQYVATLQVILHGCSVGSTEEVVEASSPAEAEEQAIAAWREAEPRYEYRPLLTMQK